MATSRRKTPTKKLKYTTKPVKSRRMPGFVDIIWQVRENTRKVVNVFEFEDDMIEDRQEQIATANNLHLINHSLYLYGECKNAASCEHNQSSQD